MYNIGDVFGIDEDYSKRAKFCNENGLIIAEITKENDIERKFQIQQLPPLTEKDIFIKQIEELKSKLAKYKEDVEL